MTACREVSAALDRYLDGETAVGDRSAIEEHLGGCPECARLLAERRAAMGMLAEWVGPGARASSDVPVRARSVWLRVAAAAAALVLAGTFAWKLAEERPVASEPVPSKDGTVMRSLGAGVTVVPGKAGEPDELVVDPFPVQLCWRPMSAGVEVIRGGAGQPEELVVDPFPVKMRPMSSGVVVVPGRSGEPAELVVDPFPEEGK